MKHIDKVYHFIVGMFIFWAANFFMSYAIVPVIIIAVLKEVYDLKVKHSYMDIWDILATIFGGLMIWLILFIDLVVM